MSGISLRAHVMRACMRVVVKRRIRADPSVEGVRRRLRFMSRFIPGPPRSTETVTLDAGGVMADRIATPASRSDRHILYLHGGSFICGWPSLYRDLTWRLATMCRACVLCIDYRLAPEHPFPAALEDAVTIYRMLAQEFDPRRIAFMGDSAGGGLALATLYKLRDEGLALPAAAVAVSPWTDLALTGVSLKLNAATDPMLNVAMLPALANAYLGGADPRNHYASPLYGDASGLPPTLIHVGSDEILHDDAVRMAEKLRAASCEVEIEVWPRMPHAWHLFARVLPEGRDAIARIGAFLQQRL